jgi:hypothetical protein
VPEIPPYNELIWPAIVAFRELGGPVSNDELEERVIANEGFDTEQQSVLHKNGPVSEIAYRIGWARTYLKGMGLAQNIGRKIWSLTEAGITVEPSQLETLRQDYIQRSRDTPKARKPSSTGYRKPDATQRNPSLGSTRPTSPGYSKVPSSPHLRGWNGTSPQVVTANLQVPSDMTAPMVAELPQQALRVAYVTRRDLNHLPDEEWGVPGVYVLLADHGSDQVYIGQAVHLRKRLLQHRSAPKLEWRRAVAIKRDTSNGFNSAEIGYLEGRLASVIGSITRSWYSTRSFNRTKRWWPGFSIGIPPRSSIRTRVGLEIPR